MNIKPLLYVIAIEEEGSLSAAGRRLKVSQPTLSVFLSDLEKSLGIDLFLRDKKRLVPTPAGRLYLEAARHMVQVKETTYQTIHHLTHEPLETILVGATPFRGSIITAQIYPTFSRRYPNIKVEIREGYMKNIREQVRAGEVTYALGSCYDSQDPEIDYIIISREEVVVGVPAFHSLAALAESSKEGLSSIEIEQLADTPLIQMAKGTTIRSMTDSVFSQRGIHPTVVFETNNNLVLSNMIREGAGAGLLPRSLMVPQATDILYFSLKPKYYLSLCAMVQKNKRLTKAERYFLYLVMKKDLNNPNYHPAMNQAARDIYNEFDRKETDL